MARGNKKRKKNGKPLLDALIVELTCIESGEERTLVFSGDLLDCYSALVGHPPVCLVHGEERSQIPLAEKLRLQFDAPVTIAQHGQTIDVA